MFVPNVFSFATEGRLFRFGLKERSASDGVRLPALRLGLAGEGRVVDLPLTPRPRP